MESKTLKLYTYHGRYGSGCVVVAASKEEAIDKIPAELSRKGFVDPRDVEEFELADLKEDFEFVCWADI